MLIVMPSPSQNTFGLFEFKPDTLELFRDGRPVELAPQPAKVLKALIEASPSAVMREDLIRAIWNGGQHVDAEHSLNACIRQLRAALGDSATSSGYIHTLPKRGYRFLDPAKATHSASNGLKQDQRWTAIVVVLIAGILGFASWGYFGNSPTSELAEASDLLLRAQAFRERGEDGDLERSIVLYDQAIIQNPGSAEALAGKALLIQTKSRNSKGLAREAEIELAVSLAKQAEELGFTANAALVLGHYTLYQQKDFIKAVEYYRQAVGRAPDNPETYKGLAQALAVVGDVEGAAIAAKQAMTLDPLKLSTRSDLCWYHLFEKNFTEARNMCAWALEIDPAHNWTLLGLVEAHRHLGEAEQAKSYYLDYLKNEGLIKRDTEIQEDIYCTGARSLLTRAQQQADDFYNAAAGFAVCGNLDQASNVLALAQDNDEQWLLYFFVDTRFDSHRAELTPILESRK